MTTEAKHLTATEIAKFRIIYALKVVVGLSKKLVMKTQRTLSNGALQFTYLVDGIRCSCFVKKAAMEKQVRLASALADGGTQGLFESGVLESVIVPALHKHGFGQAKLVEIGYNRPIVAVYPSRYYSREKSFFVGIVNDSYAVYTGLTVKKLEFFAPAKSIQELLSIINFNASIF